MSNERENRITALVTGANGFIGSHLSDLLLRRGYRVRALVRKTSNLRFLKDENIELAYGSLAASDSLLNALKDVDIVFHPAGKVKAKNRRQYFKVNQLGTRNLLHAVRKACPNLKRFVHISSQAVAGPSLNGRPLNENDPPVPVSAYGESKLAAEEELLQFKSDFPITVIRPPAVYGPRDVDIYKFFQMIKLGINPRLGFEKRYLSLVHVEDLVECIALVVETEQATNETFYAANPGIYLMDDILAEMGRAMNREFIDIMVPLPVARMVAAVVETTFGLLNTTPPFNRDKIKELSQTAWTVDSSKAERLLKWRAKIDIHDGFRQTYQWYLQEGWL